jgi:hypothetical protein
LVTKKADLGRNSKNSGISLIFCGEVEEFLPFSDPAPAEREGEKLHSSELLRSVGKNSEQIIPPRHLPILYYYYSPIFFH